MAEEPAADKTEQPTPKKLSKARKQGQVPQSQEMMSVASLVVMLAALALLAPNLMVWFTAQVRDGMSCRNTVFVNSEAFIKFFNTKFLSAVLITSPIVAALMAGAVLTGIGISGPNFATQAVKLKWNVINPAEGLQKLVNAKSMVRLAMSILKLIFVSAVVWFYLRDRLDELALLRWAWSAQIMAAIAKIIASLMIRVCLALCVLGLADLAYQKWKYIDELKMTKEEVKQERRDMEGSPQIKARIRRIQLQMSMKRMLREVPKASVVLVNPTHVSVALRYKADTMEAPVVVAKGAEHLAEKIRQIARAYGVPVLRRPELARTIYATVKLDSPIPQHLYVAVAEVLAMIYRLRQKK